MSTNNDEVENYIPAPTQEALPDSVIFHGDTGLVKAPAEELAPSNKYQVRFADWEGPYDVLLDVIHDQQLNLLDLDIAVLLEHYLDYIHNAEHINLDEAGDFLVVAATLAQIKSKLMLPKEEQVEGEVEEKDPREDLVRYLLEYQKIRQAADLLKERPILGRDVFVKGITEHFEGVEGEGRGTLFQLVRGFQKAMREQAAHATYEITREEISVSDRIKDVFSQIETSKQIEFQELLHQGTTKVFLIATFLSVLELVRLKKVTLLQMGPHQSVYLASVEGASGEDFDVYSEFDAAAAAADETSAQEKLATGEDATASESEETQPDSATAEVVH